jgi:hypothetical protein
MESIRYRFAGTTEMADLELGKSLRRRLVPMITLSKSPQ